MKSRWLALLGCGILFLWAGAAGCGDDDGAGNNNQADGAVDAEVTDGEVADGAMDGGAHPEAGTGCSGDPADPPGGNGACCTENAHCIDDFCMGGWCAEPGCDEDSDCAPAVADGAFTPGTQFNCNTNEFSFYSFCVPGSLQPCGGASDGACPAGETCQGGWDEQVTDPENYGVRGVCVADEIGAGLADPGGVCDSHAEYVHHQCRNAGYVFWSCIARRCTVFCDARNATNTCPSGQQCAGPFKVETGGGGYMTGTGLCTGDLCGSMQFTSDPDNDLRIPGINAECPGGQVCVPFLVTGIDGDVFEMRCIPEETTLGAPGADCEQAAKFALYCNHDLCLQNPPEFNPAGATCQEDEDCGAQELCVEGSNPYLPKRCSPKPDTGFCSILCRTDADCPNMRGGPSYCTWASAGNMPNGEEAYLPVCYPVTEVFDATPVACQKEGDCDNSVGEGCVRIGGNSEASFCDVLSEADTVDGTDCTSNPSVCSADQACIDDGAGTSYCTAVLELGDPCDPEPASGDPLCLSGICLDSEMETSEGATPTNTFCLSVCTKTTDCAANQVCQGIKIENDPNDDTDDVLFGLCRPYTVRYPGTECTAGSCGGAMACDTATGRCYTTGVAWGSACTDHSDCALNGFCLQEAVNGVCYLPGCDPANGNADCNDAGSTCSTIYGVGTCLEACTVSTDCSRNGTDGHICDNGACVEP